MKGKVVVILLIVLVGAVTCLSLAYSDNWIGSTPYSYVFALADDGEYLLTATEWGFTKLHKTAEDIAFYHKRLGDGLPAKRINTLAGDNQGNTWIGTDVGGLTKFDGTNWTVYTTDSSELPNNTIYSLASDNQGNVWVGTSGGCAKYDNGNWTVYNTDNSWLPNNTVRAFAFDDDGNTWIGTNYGLGSFDGENWLKYGTSDSDIPSNKIQSLATDNEGNLWAGTNLGLGLFDGDTWTVYKKEDFGLESSDVNDLTIDIHGNVWICNETGFAQFDGETWKVFSTDDSGLLDGIITAFTSDRDGSVWIGNQYGLVKFDGTNWKQYNTGILEGEDTWSKRAYMPTKREELGVCAVNGKIYAIGGTNDRGASSLSHVEKYDPVTDSWATKSPMPTAKSRICASVVNGKIYIMNESDTSVKEYNPVTDTWTTKAAMPKSLNRMSCCVVNGKIYVIGAFAEYVNGRDIFTQTTEVYDPTTDSWEIKSPVPSVRVSYTACEAEGIIYVIGGRYTFQNTSALVEAYDPVKETWSQKADMLSERYEVSACLVNGKIYAIGGRCLDEQLMHFVEEYDPIKNIWTKKTNIPMYLRYRYSSCVLDRKIYIIGGSNINLGPFETGGSLVYVYDPGAGEPTFVEDSTPTEFTLLRNYPNPFNPVTTINYRLDQAGMVKLVIYDLLGRKVTTLVDEMKTPGSYAVKWRAEGYASGVYFYRLEHGGSKVLTQKMILLK